MKISDKDKIQVYIDFLPFLHAVLGDNAEIVVHDLTHENNSIVAIENPLSERKIGYPLTDLAKELVHRGDEEHMDYIANYQAKSKGKSFVSYTFFIKNNGKNIGLLCINKDTKASVAALEAIVELINKNNLNFPEENKFLETLDSTVEDFLNDKIQMVIKKAGISVENMSKKIKKEIVYQLDDEDILKQRGAIGEIAKQLDISVPTIYRYLKEREK